MALKSRSTKFASAERSAPHEIERQRKLVAESMLGNPITNTMLNTVFDIILVLDKNRQAVFANSSLQRFLGVNDLESVLGKRPGEIFNCVYANSTEWGCGTTEFCRFCGATTSIIAAQEGRENVEECLVTQRNGNAVDLAVASSPIRLGEEDFVFFAIRNITDKKRRELLEGVFFHDMLNTTSVIWTATEMLKSGRIERQQELIDKIHTAAYRLVEEIKSQGDLTKAERSELAVNIEEAEAMDMIDEAVSFYLDMAASRGVRMEVDAKSEDAFFRTDPVLLRRVLGNIIRNAIEVADEGEVVRIGSHVVGDWVEFKVNNKSVMPPDVAMNIFKRSFSTKGKGRGLGTYSVKLLTERYLHGKATFTSNKDEGTTFSVSYPLKPPAGK